MERFLFKSCLFCCAVIGTVLIYSNTGGPTGTDATGSPFDSNQNACTQCHTTFGLNSGTGAVSINAPSSYYPGESYSVTINVSQSVPVPAKYGFQTVALRDNNAAGGTMTGGTGLGTFTQGGRSYVQQNSTANTSGNFTFTWNAPSFSDTVVFYTSGMAANGGNGNNNDYVYTSTATVFPIAPIEFTTSFDTTSCFGICDGVASVNVTGGGIAPYSYTWSTGDTTTSIDSLCPGVYILTITDDEGHEETTAVTVPSPPEIVSQISTLPSSCAFGDGQIMVSPVNGQAPYTYQWNNSAGTIDSVILQAGVGWFTVTITDAFGCEKIDSAEVLASSSGLVGLTQSSNEHCNGSDGFASINMVAGNSPYGFIWSNGNLGPATLNQTAGTYTVTVTDNIGCTETFEAIIEEDSLLIDSNATFSNDPLCFNSSEGSVSIGIASGINPITYEWSHDGSLGSSSASGLFAGEYLVTVTDDVGCNDTLTFLINEPDSIAITSVADSSGNGQCDGTLSLTVNGGVSPYSFIWPHDASEIGISASDLCSGNYVISVTDANNCLNLHSAIVYEKPLGITSVNTQQSWIYPNPATDEVNLHLPYNLVELVRLIDSEGKISEYNISESQGRIDLSKKPNGNYTVVYQMNGILRSSPLIIAR